MNWQLQQAKARFSELVQKALDDGPQTVTRRGKPCVVVLSAEQFELMKKRQISLKDLLAAIPLDGLEIERDKSPRETSTFEIPDRHQRSVRTQQGRPL